jgi:hypothetical protein
MPRTLANTGIEGYNQGRTPTLEEPMIDSDGHELTYDELRELFTDVTAAMTAITEVAKTVVVAMEKAQDATKPPAPKPHPSPKIIVNQTVRPAYSTQTPTGLRAGDAHPYTGNFPAGQIIR